MNVFLFQAQRVIGIASNKMFTVFTQQRRNSRPLSFLFWCDRPTPVRQFCQCFAIAGNQVQEHLHAFFSNCKITCVLLLGLEILITSLSNLVRNLGHGLKNKSNKIGDLIPEIYSIHHAPNSSKFQQKLHVGKSHRMNSDQCYDMQRKFSIQVYQFRFFFLLRNFFRVTILKQVAISSSSRVTQV